MNHSDLYLTNGLTFWSEEEIRLRSMIVDHMVAVVRQSLLGQNQAFKLVQCEAPQITPTDLINPNYSKDDYYQITENLTLRPETTMGSYLYAKHVLSGYHTPKYKLPLCVWQHGKSFRREQDQPSKYVRLKEFYQLEFQILFSSSTSNDYYPSIVANIRQGLSEILSFAEGRNSGVYVQRSDRLPSYSTETMDVMFANDPEALEGMEVCSISRRTDYQDGVHNIEVAIGTDRCVYNYLKRRVGNG